MTRILWALAGAAVGAIAAVACGPRKRGGFTLDRPSPELVSRAIEEYQRQEAGKRAEPDWRSIFKRREDERRATVPPFAVSGLARCYVCGGRIEGFYHACPGPTSGAGDQHSGGTVDANRCTLCGALLGDSAHVCWTAPSSGTLL